MLHIYYRISDNGFKKNKPDYITKENCLRNALDVFQPNVSSFHVYIDGVNDETDKMIHSLCDNRENTTVSYLECRSGGFSFMAVFNEACKLNDEDCVYFLEDDYIHKPNAYVCLMDALSQNYTEYITLYDHPDKYSNNTVVNGGSVNPRCKNGGERTVVFKTNTTHWKITESTTMTFASHVRTIKEDKEVFEKHTSTGYPFDDRIFLELRTKGRCLSSPIPSLSTHGETAYLAPFVDWGKLVRKESIQRQSCCIAFMTHKPQLSGDEERSWKRCISVFGGKRDIFVVIPENVNTDYYTQSEWVKVKQVNKGWMSSYDAYNLMCVNQEFYKLFSDYDYMLIYQSDCWVYEDRLDYFMSLGFDWYGAPWPHEHDAVGNGGFSLRKVSKMIDMTKRHPAGMKINEDLWFCKRYGSELNACDLKTACNFSLELVRDKYLALVDDTPMGLHSKNVKKWWGEKENFKK